MYLVYCFQYVSVYRNALAGTFLKRTPLYGFGIHLGRHCAYIPANPDKDEMIMVG